MNSNPDEVELNFFQRVMQSTLVRIVLLLLVVGLGAITAYFLVLILKEFLPENSPVSLLMEALVVPAIVSGFYLVAARIHERRAVSELSRTGAGWELGAGVLLGAGLFALATALLWLAGVYQPGGWNGWAAIFPALAVVLPSAILSELAARGVVMRIVEERMGAYTALLVSALLFGLIHAAGTQSTPLGILSAAVIPGVLMGAAYLLTRRLWLPIGMHLAWDFAKASLFGAGDGSFTGLVPSALNGPPLLTGGTGGVEASVVLIGVAGIAGVVLALRAWKKWGYE